MLVSLIRTILLFIIIIASVRLMGKRQIGEMQASELVVTLLISNIAAIPMQETGVPLLSGVVPILTLVTLEIFLSLLMLKNSRFRRLVSGKPIVVIADGKIDQAAMKRLRLANEDLFEELRKAGVFDVTSVDCAIVEPDGVLSVLQKTAQMPPTAQKLGIEAPESGLSVLVVSDGELQKESMRLIGWSSERVEKEISRQSMSMDEVFIMVANAQGESTIIRRNEK